jgi:hypothetical protein
VIKLSRQNPIKSNVQSEGKRAYEAYVEKREVRISNTINPAQSFQRSRQRNYLKTRDSSASWGGVSSNFVSRF